MKNVPFFFKTLVFDMLFLEITDLNVPFYNNIGRWLNFLEYALTLFHLISQYSHSGISKSEKIELWLYASIFKKQKLCKKNSSRNSTLYKFHIKIYLESFVFIYHLHHLFGIIYNLNITLNYWFISKTNNIWDRIEESH